MPGLLAEKFDLEGCIQCGRCTGACPVSVKSPLNVRKVVQTGLMERWPVSGDTIPNRGGSGHVPDGDVLGIWECTTCTTCNLRCPKEIKPADLIVGLRSELIEKGRMQTTVQAALESTYLQGNPWSRARETRLDWAKDLDVRIVEEGASADVFFFVCCTACYDPRVAETARAMVRIFRATGVDFGIIGSEESCCCSEIARLGERGLFEELMNNNLELFRKRKFNQVVVLSPHCYNTFKHEYKDFPFPVKHYTQFLQELLDAKRLKLSKPLTELVTYHDPCFLGKQNKIYDEPRKLLRSAAGKQFVELDRSRETSLCCEGGGGKMWIESAGKGRLAEIRVRDAVGIGAKTITSSCPFCLLTLEDAVKTTGNEEKLRARDLTEILADAL